MHLVNKINFLFQKNCYSNINELQLLTFTEEQGWRGGESACLPPMWNWSDFQTQRHMWLAFVGSLLCSERFFSAGTPVSPSPQKPTLI